jgi:hypothetical protein
MGMRNGVGDEGKSQSAHLRVLTPLDVLFLAAQGSPVTKEEKSRQNRQEAKTDMNPRGRERKGDANGERWEPNGRDLLTSECFDKLGPHARGASEKLSRFVCSLPHMDTGCSGKLRDSRLSTSHWDIYKGDIQALFGTTQLYQ